jgi:NAD(P)H-hydrate epimerase
MSKLFTAAQMRAWDAFTIVHEPISSFALMERAATACTNWISAKWPDRKIFFAIFCGSGNNGGDGFVIARQLLTLGYRVHVFADHDAQRSSDAEQNYNELQRLYPSSLYPLQVPDQLSASAIIIDALFGSGLNRALEMPFSAIVHQLNAYPNTKVSIDIPSCMSADFSESNGVCIKADYTLTFEQWKPSFLLPETGGSCGDVQVLPIGLHNGFAVNEASNWYVIDVKMMADLYTPRLPFSHKGTYGHALLIAGSKGKMGASVLASKACLQTGAGLLTACVPESTEIILHTALPEAMTISRDALLALQSVDSFQAIGIGCGLGIDNEAEHLLDQLLSRSTLPLVIDADAITILSHHPEWLSRLPKGSLLTPHPKESDRLTGECANTLMRLHQLQKLASTYHIFILLKGRFSVLCTPEGEYFINTTGNAGMAKGGSGDTLTGMITALFAQYKQMRTAALLGMYLHGRAGDLAALRYGVESMLPSELANCIGEAFQEIHEAKQSSILS